MYNKLYFSLYLFINLFIINEIICGKPCAERKIAGADSVCVCNQTYCDDFVIQLPPTAGHALVYESGKSGQRFHETQLKFNDKHQHRMTTTGNGKQTQTINIDRNQKYQSIVGFGGAFTDEFGMVLNAVPKQLSQYIMDSYFSPNGIQYNMGRLPVAATDYSAHYYSYDDTVDDKSLSKFSMTKEDLELKLPHLETAKALVAQTGLALKLFGSAWVAPDWMKTGPKDPNPNQLKGETGGEYYEIFANYLVKFLDAYKAKNISIWGLTTQNEPTWGRQFIPNDVYFDPEMQKAFVAKNLGPALHKSGYTSDKLKLMIYDDNVYPEDSWHHKLQEYADIVLANPDAQLYVSGIAYHWYESKRDQEYPDSVLDEVHQKHPDQFLLMTEACHLEGLGNGRWDFGEHYAHDIIRDLNHWTTGWIEWNMALGLNGCPRCGPNQCGTAIIVDIEKVEAYKQPTFYTIGHFSKFLSPNSVRIGHQLDADIKNLYVLSVQRPDNTVVVVALNQNDSEIDLKINDLNKHLTHTIPARSIQTFVWQ